MHRAIKWVLNILTCLSLILGLLIISTISDSKSPINAMEGLYFGLNVIWVFLLFLPISIGNIIYSLYLKRKNKKYKSNLILGIIFSILLLALGSMHFLSQSDYTEDKNYLYNLEKEIGIDLPDDFSILTQDWTDGKQTSSDGIYIKCTSVVRFEGDQNLVFTSEWISSVESYKEYIPNLFYYETINYENFLIYCFNSNESNPSNFNLEYDYIVLGYDYENNNLLIYEYNFTK